MAKSFSWTLEYKDSTPKLNVGHSAFENWFQAQPFATQSGIKQMCRDSYAAGMGDPLVTYADDPDKERHCIICGDKLMSDFTDTCYACNQTKNKGKFSIAEIKGKTGANLYDFAKDQWWVQELEAIAKKTPDQKRVMAVIRNLLDVIEHVKAAEKCAG